MLPYYIVVRGTTSAKKRLHYRQKRIQHSHRRMVDVQPANVKIHELAPNTEELGVITEVGGRLQQNYQEDECDFGLNESTDCEYGQKFKSKSFTQRELSSRQNNIIRTEDFS